MPSVLKTLQDAVVGRLRQQLSLPGVSILARRTGDLASQVAAAVQSALGVSLIVLDPQPRRVAASVPGPAFLDITLEVRVIENLLITNAGADLLAVAERASQVLHLWPLPPPAREGVLQLTDTDPWTTPTGPLRGAVAIDLHFHTTGTLAAPTAP